MPPSPSMQSRQSQNSAAASSSRLDDAKVGNFDLRDTLTATVVRELSFAEFRAALEKSGKRLA
jgi:hypothetical protein